jgi:dTDP-glucose 4,6-dehydratase
MKKILITGGAGFIGSHLVKFFVKEYPTYQIYNLDALTYAGNLENLKQIENAPNYTFINEDIINKNFVEDLFFKYRFDHVIHLAAESHVDRSITNPLKFIETNVVGTVNLLNSFKNLWGTNFKDKIFYHVSTDEVYGSLGSTGLFTENTPYDPRSPYSASKASSDHFVRAYGETYKIPYLISNCSNNYGEFQYPEKLIPLFIKNILEKKQLPVYGDGNYTRDWLYVKDHVNAINQLFHSDEVNQTFNIGGFNEWKNIDLVNLLCEIMDDKLNMPKGSSSKLISFVKDRPGHDLRYAIDASKINNTIGWEPSVTFEKGLEITVDWYLTNKDWLKIK